MYVRLSHFRCCLNIDVLTPNEVGVVTYEFLLLSATKFESR